MGIHSGEETYSSAKKSHVRKGSKWSDTKQNKRDDQQNNSFEVIPLQNPTIWAEVCSLYPDDPIIMLCNIFGLINSAPLQNTVRNVNEQMLPHLNWSIAVCEELRHPRGNEFQKHPRRTRRLQQKTTIKQSEVSEESSALNSTTMTRESLINIYHSSTNNSECKQHLQEVWTTLLQHFLYFYIKCARRCESSSSEVVNKMVELMTLFQEILSPQHKDREIFERSVDFLLKHMEKSSSRIITMRALASILLGNIDMAGSRWRQLLDCFLSGLVVKCGEMEPPNTSSLNLDSSNPALQKDESLLSFFAVEGIANLLFIPNGDKIVDSRVNSGVRGESNVVGGCQSSSNSDFVEILLSEKKPDYFSSLVNVFSSILSTSDKPLSLSMAQWHRYRQLSLYALKALLQRTPRLTATHASRLLTTLRPLLGAGLVRHWSHYCGSHALIVLHQTVQQNPSCIVTTRASHTNNMKNSMNNGSIHLRTAIEQHHQRHQQIEKQTSSSALLLERSLEQRWSLIKTTHNLALIDSEFQRYLVYGGGSVIMSPAVMEDGIPPLLNTSESDGSFTSDGYSYHGSSSSHESHLLGQSQNEGQCSGCSGDDWKSSSNQGEQRWYKRIRQLSGECVVLLLRSLHRRYIMECWTSFLPHANRNIPSLPSLSQPTLLTLLMKEPSALNRGILLQAMALLFESSKTLLMGASDCGPSGSLHAPAYTSYSSLLGEAIHEIHRSLLIALMTEESPYPWPHMALLRAFIQLLPTIPYAKMRRGMLLCLARLLIPYTFPTCDNVITPLREKLPTNIELQVCALQLWRVMMQLESSPLAEVCQILNHSLINDKQEIDFTANDSPTTSLQNSLPPLTLWTKPETVWSCSPEITSPQCWLVEQLLKIVLDDDPGMNYILLKQSVVHIFIAMCDFYESYLWPTLMNLLPVLSTWLETGESHEGMGHKPHIGDTYQRREDSLRLLSRICESLVKKDKCQSNNSADPLCSQCNLRITCWNVLIDKVVLWSKSGMGNTSVRSAALDCLSVLDEISLQHLPSQSLTGVMSTLLDAVTEVDVSVKASALRSLTILIQMPSMYKMVDNVWSVVMASARICADNQGAIISNTSSTCMSYGLKVLLSLHLQGEDVLSQFLRKVQVRGTKEEESFLDVLVHSAIHLSQPVLRNTQEKDVTKKTLSTTPSKVIHSDQNISLGGVTLAKMCESGLRSLGYILRMVPSSFIPHLNKIVQMICQSMLIQDVNGAAKLRWNGCYAAYQILCNDEIDSAPWLSTLLRHLCTALEQDTYFKVCNNSCLTLHFCLQRRPDLWWSIANCISNEEIVNKNSSQTESIGSSRSLLEHVVRAMCLANQRAILTPPNYNESHHTSQTRYIVPLLWLRLCATLPSVSAAINFHRYLTHYSAVLCSPGTTTDDATLFYPNAIKNLFKLLTPVERIPSPISDKWKQNPGNEMNSSMSILPDKTCVDMSDVLQFTLKELLLLLSEAKANLEILGGTSSDHLLSSHELYGVQELMFIVCSIEETVENQSQLLHYHQLYQPSGIDTNEDQSDLNLWYYLDPGFVVTRENSSVAGPIAPTASTFVHTYD